MKKTEKFIVVRNTETGQFLTKYKNNDGAFTSSSTWSENIQDAATNALGSLERNEGKVQKMAEALGGEILVVNATYELETLDGEEPKDLMEEIEQAKREHIKNFLCGLLAEDEDEED